jgi:hypothetical protein
MGSDAYPAEIRQLLDKEAIREATLRYARGLDRHDYALMASAYHPDAVDDHGPYIGAAAGFVDLHAREDSKREWSAQQHYMLNQLIELDGDTAHVETYYLATMRRKDGLVDIAGGRYLDRCERREGRWAVAERVCVVEWTGELARTERTLDPHLFVQGTWDRTDVSYQRPLKVTRPQRGGQVERAS